MIDSPPTGEPPRPPFPEVWAGFECTVRRMGDAYLDQLVLTGHDGRHHGSGPPHTSLVDDTFVDGLAAFAAAVADATPGSGATLVQTEDLGKVNAATGGGLSWHAFATMVAEMAGWDRDAIAACTSAELSFPAQRPAYNVLASRHGEVVPRLEHAVARHLGV